VIFLVARQRYLQVGWLWFLLTLLPVSGVVQVSVQGRADRYMYLPIVGLLIIIIRTLVRTGAYFSPARRRWWRRLAFGLGLGSVLALMMVASIQVAHWHDSLTFYTYQVSVVPNDPYFHTNLAYHLYKRGDYDAAIAHCRRALAVSPDLAQAHLVLAGVYDDLGEHEEAQREEQRARGSDLSRPETPTRMTR
jgi:tetratricopeptide (TPR) repeat protein